MKKQILLVLTLLSIISHAQQFDKLYWNPAEPDQYYIKKNLFTNGFTGLEMNWYGGIKFLTEAGSMIFSKEGLMGIGTDNPQTRLDVNGGFRAGSGFTSFRINHNSPDILFSYSDYGSGGRAIVHNPNNILTINYNGDFTGGTKIGNVAYFNNNGNVGIGSLNPDSRLTVKGLIHAEEVKVDLNVPADYVFQKYYTGSSTLKPEYKMPTLEYIEEFTKENNHLPNIPSAKEIKENGMNVGEMTNLLLQKIEELTLYTIEQNKRIKELESKIKP
jgi:hypothetical protein